MSKELFDQVGFKDQDLEPLESNIFVATAHEGARMKILGRLKNPILIQLGNCSKPFEIQPYVIPGLSMGLNLSKLFMSHYGIDELHSMNSLRYGQELIPLETSNPMEAVASGTASEVPEKDLPPGISIAYLREGVSVKSGETVEVPLVMPNWTQGEEPFMAHIDADPLFYLRTGCLPERSRVKPTNKTGNLVGQIMNITGEDIRIEKGFRYGTVFRVNPCLASMEAGRLSENEIRLKIRNGFKLNAETCALKSPEEKQEAEDLLFDYRDLFAWNGECGRTSLIDHRIPLKPNTGPIYVRTRPLNPNLEAGFRDQILGWLKNGIIKECKSPYNAGVVVVPKKRLPGQVQTYRYCIDYRKVYLMGYK